MIDKALERVRKNFDKGVTKPYSYRMSQLSKLKSGMERMKKELSQALTNDLAKDDFVNWMYEIQAVDREIDHAMQHLKGWMKDECVDTPLFLGPGKSYI